MKNWTKIVAAVLALGAAFLTGRCARGGKLAMPVQDSPAVPRAAERWTCPMHPQVVLPQFGRCPVCSMDLVPYSMSSSSQDVLEMDARSVELAGVRTVEAAVTPLSLEVPLVGTVRVAETAVRTIAANVSGRIERLYVDYTGVEVRVGDHLFELYSPALLTAQEELLSAVRQLDQLSESNDAFARSSAERAARAAREKLRLWQFSQEQIEAIETRATALPSLQVLAPVGGTVIEKRVEQGDFVEPGTVVYELADLAQLWLELEAFEQDLGFLHYGQPVEFTAQALPGVHLRGTVLFVDPTVDARSRTASVRVHVDNSDGELKPGMFVRATILARLDDRGRARATELAGKWISPMHPEILSDQPGLCSVCGMDLVPAESLGLVSAEDFADPLVIPEGAVLRTGKRAVVYVLEPGSENPGYRARVIELGPRVDDAYVVLGGLSAGEQVVAQGAFRVDSSMQIQAGQSMMSMQSESEQAAKLSFSAAFESFWSIQDRLVQALAADDLALAKLAFAELAHDAQELQGLGLVGDSQRELLIELQALASDTSALEQLADLRRELKAIARLSHELLESIGNRSSRELRWAFCPMAFEGRGAHWIQGPGELINPYFGASMLHCGTFEQSFEAAKQ